LLFFYKYFVSANSTNIGVFFWLSKCFFTKKIH
jgi:hypothetical protein